MNKNISIIVFTGKKLSGKTTSGKYLVEKHNYLRLRFANTLKEMLITFGLTEEEVDGNLKELPCEKLGGKTPVHAMQTLGTEWGRDLIYGDIWVDALNRELMTYIDNGLTRFVIDDLRFLNEKEYVESLRKKYNVVVVKLWRSGTVVGTHRSETEIDKIMPNIEIGNYDDLESLYSMLDNLLSDLDTLNKEK